MKFCLILIALFYGCLALPRTDGPQCQAPNGGGITPIIEEFTQMLPVSKLLDIYLTAVSSDPEVQKVMEYLETDEYQDIISTVTTTPEFAKLIHMACNELYFDLIYHWNVLNDQLGLPLIPRPNFLIFSRLLFTQQQQQLEITDKQTRSRSGFNGMLQDLIDTIDVNALKKLFDEKTQSDPFVQKALEILKSEDYKRLVQSLEATPAWNKFLDEFRQMGVQVDELIEFLRKYFGW